MYNVLFICTANICRTPIAHYYLKHLLKKDGLESEINVQSAGTWAIHGIPAAHFSRLVCNDHGIDLDEHQSQPIDLPLMKSADIVLCLAIQHKYDLCQIFPHFRSKIFTLKEYLQEDPGDDYSIDDPYGKNIELYRETFDNISREVERIFPALVENSRQKTA